MRPQLRPDFSPRPRLNRLIESRVASHRLTLINAPAGYGKTTAAQAWAEHTRSFEVLWLNLDPQDNHPLEFLAGLIAVFRQIQPDFGRALLPTIAGQTAASLDPPQAFGLLINELLESLSRPHCLVLDDLHHLTRQDLGFGLDYFIEHLPPFLRLLATARVEPPLSLPRMRGRAQLGEVLPPDLRFTRQETAAFFSTGLKLDLPDQSVRSFYDRSEGWIAGLRLMAGHPPSEVDPPAGPYPINERARENVFALLAAEVLDKQGEEIRSFLLETSILDELTPALCAQVTESPDAPLLLEEVYRRNLFLSAVTDRRTGETVFSYHDLFREFLQQQLQRERPGDKKQLHRRAGRNHPDIGRAVHHLLAGDDYEAAAGRIAADAPGLFERGRYAHLRIWIEQLPQKTREKRPWLVYFLGACQWVAYDQHAALSTLERARELFESLGDPAGTGETLVLLSTIVGTFGDIEKARQLDSLADLTPLSRASRTQLLLNRVWLEIEAPRRDLSSYFDQALDLVEHSTDPGAFQIAAMSVREIPCMLPEGRQAAHRLRGLIASRVPLDQAGIPQNTYFTLGSVLAYLEGDLDAAIESANRSFGINRQLGGMPILQGQLVMLMAMVRRLQGQRELVNNYLGMLDGMVGFLPGWQSGLRFPSGLIAWENGDSDLARRILASMDPAPGEQERVVGPFCRRSLGGLIEIRAGRYSQALQALQQAAALQGAHPYLYFFGDMRLALAYGHLQAGEPEPALERARASLKEWGEAELPGMALTSGDVILPPVLELAATNGVQPAFARQIGELLAALKAPQPLPVPGTGQVLTAREAEVLQLLTTGATNQAIADELVISLATVKTHVSRILSKLDVSSRSQAIARVRDLNLF